MIKKFFSLVIGLSMLCINHTTACTDFTIATADKAIINGRSMEFGLVLNSNIIVFPRGEKHTSKTPNGKDGTQWTSQYGFVAADCLGLGFPIDGLNEKGLSIGFLWLPGTQYQEPKPSDADKTLAIEDLGFWLLGNFMTVSEVNVAIKNMFIWSHEFPQINGIPPLHIAIHDAQGNNLVIEFVDGVMKVYDNPNSVLTNYPTFDWQIINLRNYINLTAINKGSVNLSGSILGPTGEGSGLLGIPGDWTPPSRFVRITAFKSFAKLAENSTEGVHLAAHLLNTVDIPKGNIRSAKGEATADFTQWVVIKDLTNRMFYFRSYDNLDLKVIDLKKLNFTAGSPKNSLPIDLSVELIDVTRKL